MLSILGHLRAVLGHGLCQVLHDSSVDVEQVVTCHARLARHSSRDDHKISTLQSCSQVLLPCVSSHLMQALKVTSDR